MSMGLMPFVDFYQSLVPYIILAIVLIIADSRFGVEAAQKRGRSLIPRIIRESNNGNFTDSDSSAWYSWRL